jgi:hypothetical protein
MSTSSSDRWPMNPRIDLSRRNFVIGATASTVIAIPRISAAVRPFGSNRTMPFRTFRSASVSPVSPPDSL